LKKGILQTFKFSAFLVAGLLLLWFAFRNINFGKLSHELMSANYSWIFLSVFFGFLAFASRARRWVLLIYPLGFKPSNLNAFWALMAGYLANLALPRIGEITRCVALGRKENIPVDQLIGTVVIERTIDFISLLSIMVALLVTSGDQISRFMKETILTPVQDKIGHVFGNAWVLWLLLLALITVFVILLVKYKNELRRIRFFAKLFSIGRGIINGLKTITKLNRKWEFIFHTVFIWVNYSLMTWVVFFAIESTSGLKFSDGIFVLVIGGLAMSAPVQSGLGAFHYIVSRGLLMVKDIPLEDGLVYALLTHESQLIFVVIIGTISFFMIFRRHRKPEPD
jgi:glycosyltransferase 2 family protein